MVFFRKEIVFSLLINLFHYYSFAVYAFSAIILAPKFFHMESEELTNTLAVLSISMTILIRPLGGLIFGHIGDRYGRKKAITLSLFVVTLSTSAIGLLPTYESAGVMSSFLLTICLFLQGLCMSGQYAGAIIFIQEHTYKYYAAFSCGIVGAVGVLGTLLGTMSSNLFYQVTSFDWAWRVPFLVTLFIGFLLLCCMNCMKETPVFLENQEKFPVVKIPFLGILKNHKALLFSTFCLSSIPIALFYLSTVYVPNFLNPQKVNSISSLNVSSIALGACILFIPLFGLLADTLGKEKLLKLTSLFLILIPFLVYYTEGENNRYLPYYYSITLAIFVGLYLGPATAYLSEKFPHRSRYSGLGLGIAIGEGAGALAPLICILIKDYYGSLLAPSYFLTFLGLLGLFGLFVSIRSDSVYLEEKKLAA